MEKHLLFAGSSCDAAELCLTLIGIFEATIAKPSVGIPGDVNDRFTSCGHALQNLLARSSVAKQTAMDGNGTIWCLHDLSFLPLSLLLTCWNSRTSVALMHGCRSSGKAGGKKSMRAGKELRAMETYKTQKNRTNMLVSVRQQCWPQK